MPQHARPPEQMTPFAQVLIDYMWNKRPRNQPPLTYAQLSVRLGVPKQSVSNWILRGSVPPLDTIMVILARLGIPLRDLYDAYLQAGLPTPAWDASDASPIASGIEEPVTPRSRKPTVAPLPAAPLSESNSDVPQPKPYIPPAQPYNPEAAEAAEWDRMIAQAQAVMRAEGASDELVDAITTHLRSRQQPGPDPMQQHIIAEHSEPTELDEQPKHPEQQKRQKRQEQQHTHK